MTKIDETAIVKTLAYADIFDYPLTLKQIHHYLITNTKTSLKQTSLAIYRCCDEGIIHKKNSLYFLNGRKEIVTLRKKRQHISQEKRKKLQSTINHLQKFPTILGVFTTGALAMDNADKDDDLDLMIITKKNALWTTRLLVTFLLQITSKRRKPKQRKASDKVCINLWLDESTLTVPLDHQNLYTAHEVIQAKPAINRQHIHQRFLNANAWVSSHLPNAIKPQPSPYPVPKQKSSMIRIIEQLAYRLQRWYMKDKRTRELVTRHAAYFHPRDSANHILGKYQKKLKALEINKAQE